VRIIADTNILVRFIVRDTPVQFASVCALFARCAEVVIPTPVLCELCWVLGRGYGFKSSDLLDALERLIKSQQVTVSDDEVEAGLSLLRQGGDFADGVNACAGRKLSKGNAVFASFDRKAVRLLSAQGVAALVPE